VFNLQGSELVIILLLALVVLGPEKLPEAMRRLGQFTAQLKKMSSGFQQEFKAAVDEPMREVRKTADMLRDSMDFRNLQDGSRDEKPKSGDMAAQTPSIAPPVTPPEPAPERVPTDDVPFQEHPVADGETVDVPLETLPPEQPSAADQPPAADEEPETDDEVTREW
jgi:sec-independent protein translocase protein TatB